MNRTVILKLLESGPYTHKEIMQKLNWSNGMTQRALKTYMDLGVVDCDAKRQPYQYSLAKDKTPEAIEMIARTPLMLPAIPEEKSYSLHEFIKWARDNEVPNEVRKRLSIMLSLFADQINPHERAIISPKIVEKALSEWYGTMNAYRHMLAISNLTIRERNLEKLGSTLTDADRKFLTECYWVVKEKWDLKYE